jgi:hypothetical protein
MTPRIGIIQKLKQAAKKVDNINRGGCAIHAIAIHDYIARKYPETNPKIIYVLDEYEDAGYLQYMADNMESDHDFRDMCCSHALVKIEFNGKDRFLDSTGFKKKATWINMEREYIYIDRQKCIDHVNKSSWNETFKRVESLPVLDEIWESNLREIISW